MKKKLLTTTLSLSFILFSFTSTLGQVFADFEGVTKGTYATSDVVVNGNTWEFVEAAVGSLASDWKIGDRSARLRGYAASKLELKTPKTDGIGSIHFYYRRYGTDAQVDWKVEYTADDGITWTQIGESFTATADQAQFFETVNQSGSIRVRIVRATDDGNATNRRLNIDEIVISNWPTSISNLATDASSYNTGDIINMTWDAVGVSQLNMEIKNLDGQWTPLTEDPVDAALGSYQYTIPYYVPGFETELRAVDDFDSRTVSNIVDFTIVDTHFAGLNPTEGLYPSANATDEPIDLYVIKSGEDDVDGPWAWSSRNAFLLNFYEYNILPNIGNVLITKQGEASPLYSIDVSIAGNVEMLNFNSIARVILPENLEPETTYEVEVPSGAFVDGAATPNESDLITWSFTTGTRQGATSFSGLVPQKALWPEQNDVDVYIDLHNNIGNPLPGLTHKIFLTFIDNQLSFNSGYISIFKEGESTPVYQFDVELAPELNIESNRVIVNINENLLPSTEYTVVVDDGAIIDQSVPSNSWEGITWSFTTGALRGGHFSPNLHPANGAEDVKIDLFLFHEGLNDIFSNSIILGFNDPIAKGSGNITVKKLLTLDEVYTFDVATSDNILVSGKYLIVVLPATLEPNTAYEITAENGVVTNFSDNSILWEGTTWSFTTGSESSHKTIYQIRDQKSEPAYIGEFVVVSGVVTKKMVTGAFFLQDGSTGWNGIYVNNTTFDINSLVEGNTYEFVAKVAYSNEMAQLVDVRSYKNSEMPITIEPKLVTLPFIEENLSMLVKIESVTVNGAPINNEFWVKDNSEANGHISKLFYGHTVEDGDKFTSITGILHRSLGHYKLAPRSVGDLVEDTGVSLFSKEDTGIVVTPNPATDAVNIIAPVEIAEVELTSVIGERLVTQKTLSRLEASVPLTGFAKGVYLLNITLGDGQKAVVKVVKQ